MSIKQTLAAIALTAAALVPAGAGGAASAAVAHTSHATETVDSRHPCTRTSSGSCIRGGEFCRQSQYGQSGWDAQGRRYVCKGSHTHPHWMIP